MTLMNDDISSLFLSVFEIKNRIFETKTRNRNKESF